jgi:hypothetical protein
MPFTLVSGNHSFIIIVPVIFTGSKGGRGAAETMLHIKYIKRPISRTFFRWRVILLVHILPGIYNELPSLIPLVNSYLLASIRDDAMNEVNLSNLNPNIISVRQ